MSDSGPVDKKLRLKLSAAQVEDFTETFTELDEDGSGKIDTTEVKRGLQMCGMRPTDEEVTDLIQRFDVNGDGELEISEWLEMAAILFLGADDSEIVNEMFKIVSERAVGEVNPDSLYKAMGRFPPARVEDLTPETAESMIVSSGVPTAKAKAMNQKEFLSLLTHLGYKFEL